MIRRFRHRGLEALFRTGSTKGLDAGLTGKLRRMLARLNDSPCASGVLDHVAFLGVLEPLGIGFSCAVAGGSETMAARLAISGEQAHSRLLALPHFNNISLPLSNHR
jgi:hypothetical protein